MRGVIPDRKVLVRVLGLSAALIAPGGSAAAQTRLAPVPEITKTGMWDVAFADSLRGIAVGDHGVIQRSSDGGRTWSPTRSSDQFAFRNVKFISRSRAIAAGFWSSVFVSDDAGENWRKMHIDGNAHLPGMAVAASRVWLSGQNGMILASTDSGETWTAQRSGTGKMLDVISFADTLHGWCSSLQGVLLKTGDGGLNWTSVPLPSALPVTFLWAASPLICWASLFDGRIARTDDGGKTWKEMPVYGKRINRLYFDGDGRGWAVGAGGVIARYDSTTGTWPLYKYADAEELLSIAAAGALDMVAVGRNGAIIRIPVEE